MLMKNIIHKIKRFFWLIAVFIIKIVFAPRIIKAPFFKSLYFNFHGGFTSNQVALYNLDKQNKKEYLSEFDWYKSRNINYPYGYLLDNKLICVELIKDYVKVPKTLFKKENGTIFNCDAPIGINTAIEIIKSSKSVFFKPISVGKGSGVVRIDFIKDEFYLDSKKTNTDAILSILNEKDNYFVSECIKQAKYLKSIYNETSNTIRLITGRDNDKVEILCAVQRIGTSSTIPVDNGSRGGLVANIDLNTGVLSEARSSHNTNIYENHPDSNKRIKGVVIPNWKELSNSIVKVSEKLTNLKFIAWDILPTDDGFYVIEANSSSGVNIIQVFGGQRNKALGNFYRKQKIIK